MLDRYVHGASVDDPQIWYEGSTLATATRRFLYVDHQGSVVAISDNGGASLAINSYDPWGIPGAANDGRFQYTGQAWIPELGMYYYKARIYSPTLGRFMQVDPVGYKDQVNLYAYVGNDPVDHTDPTGTTCQYNRRSRSYQCNVNFNNGKFIGPQIRRVERAYTSTVNRLMANPSRHMRVTVNGVSMRVTAGQIAAGLIDAYVDTEMNPSERAVTAGGTLTPGQGLAGHPHLSISLTSVLMDRNGRTANIDRDLRRTFLHEGLHTTPGESVFQSMFDADPNKFNSDHTAPYNDASTVFDHTTPR